MPAYDSQRFEPPAPVATVILRHSNNRLLQANVLMLLDSGADVSLAKPTPSARTAACARSGAAPRISLPERSSIRSMTTKGRCGFPSRCYNQS